METKKSKTAGIIGTLMAILLCGCPGLIFFGIGVWAATGSMPYTSSFNNYSSSGLMPSWIGWAMLCASLIIITIPVVVGFLTLRDKKPRQEITHFDEPLPPAS